MSKCFYWKKGGIKKHTITMFFRMFTLAQIEYWLYNIVKSISFSNITSSSRSKILMKYTDNKNILQSTIATADIYQ